MSIKNYIKYSILDQLFDIIVPEAQSCDIRYRMYRKWCQRSFFHNFAVVTVNSTYKPSL